MLPYRDDNPTRRRPVVTLVLLFVNIAVFALLQFHGRTEPIVDLPKPVSTFDLELNETSFLYAAPAIPCEVLHLRPLRVAEITSTLDSGHENSCGKATETGRQFQVALFPQKSIWLSVSVSMFLHGDVMHLAGNMLFLWIFGNNVEDRWGECNTSRFTSSVGSLRR